MATTSATDTFLLNACLDWRTGGSMRISAQHTAERLLRRRPDIAHDSIFTAVVCGDLAGVERRLAANPQIASARGGPRDWPPLLYLCSARLSLASTNDAATAIARALLERGADANAYYPGGSPDIRYSALTCVIGEGEENAPRHPQYQALARLLLERGAEPYDIQVLYNTHFHGDVLWLLERIHEFSLKAGRQADWNDPDWRMLDMGGYGPGAHYLLGIAVRKNDLRRAEWILAHGASPELPRSTHPKFQPRSTLYAEALLSGGKEMADLLARHGASRTLPTLAGVEAFTAACLQLDRERAQALLAQQPEFLRSPAAMLAAAKRGRADAVALLLELGTSVDVEDSHGTRALHEAAYAGATGVVTLLLERGAEVDPRDAEHGGTPLGWAVYGRRYDAIELLGRVSRDVFELVWTGQVERVREVLREQPELARSVAHGQTPLMRLPDDEARALELARLLLAHGADPSLKNGAGQTAADLAASRGLDEVAEWLRTRT